MLYRQKVKIKEQKNGPLTFKSSLHHRKNWGYYYNATRQLEVSKLRLLILLKKKPPELLPEALGYL